MDCQTYRELRKSKITQILLLRFSVNFRYSCKELLVVQCENMPDIKCENNILRILT